MEFCGICKYFTREDENASRGLCHRYPPIQGLWPETVYEDFCGEWTPRKTSAKLGAVAAAAYIPENKR